MIRLTITDDTHAYLSADTDGAPAIALAPIPDVGSVKVSGDIVRVLEEAKRELLNQLGATLYPDDRESLTACEGSGMRVEPLHAAHGTTEAPCVICGAWAAFSRDTYGATFDTHTRRVERVPS